MKQEEEPTLADGPAMTPPPPVRSTGRYGAKMRKNRISHQRRSSLELPAPPGAVKAASCDFSPKSEGNTMRETVGLDSHRDPEARCSRKGTLQAPTAEAWCSRTGTLQAQIPNTASDELAPAAFDPSLEYATDNLMLFWQPTSYFSQCPLRRLSSTACHILARSSI